MEKRVELSCLLDYYGGLLTERRRSLLEQAVYEDCSLSEIAEREGISRQGVRDALKRGEEQLYEIEGKLHFLRRDAALRRLLSGLLQEAGTLREEEARRGIASRVQTMIDILEGEDGL